MSVVDKLQTIQNIKENIKTAINNKGGNVGDDFTQYSTAIDGLSTGGGITKIDIAETGIKFGYSSFTTVPEWVDFSNVTDMSNMFSLMRKLTDAPMLNTSIVDNMENMFYYCQNLENVPNYNTENVTNARNLFFYCQNLKNPPTYLNLLKCNTMEGMFQEVRLKDYSFLTNWDINPKANMSSMITTNDYVEYIPAIPNEGTTDYYQSGIIQSYTNFEKLTYFGGYIGRKYNLTNTSVLGKCPNLTYESCISILNNLYDFTGNGEVPESSMGKLKVHPNFITTVGDEINIGTNKGWVITV
jgi:surface protein